MVEDEYIRKALELVREHVRRRSDMRLTDIYKLLYQGCMGPEHAITDIEAVERWLLEEWDSVPEDPDEELYEDISLHSPMYRLNLRPAKARGIAPSRILEEFYGAGRRFPRNGALLVGTWEAVMAGVGSGDLSLPDGDEAGVFHTYLRERGYPAVHHSPEYAKRYRPAYRLVARKVA